MCVYCIHPISGFGKCSLAKVSRVSTTHVSTSATLYSHKQISHLFIFVTILDRCFLLIKSFLPEQGRKLMRLEKQMRQTKSKK